MDLAKGLTFPRGGGLVNFGQKYSVSADRWLFPLLVEYTFCKRKAAPFIRAGPTLRHLGSFDGKGIELDFYLQPQPASVHIETSRVLVVAITAGTGLKWRISIIYLTSEIRFLHRTSQYYKPIQNQEMFLLG